MINLFKKFIKEEDGATIIEYVIMLAVIAGIVMFAFPNLRSALSGWLTGMFGDVGTGLENKMELTCPDTSSKPGLKVADLNDCN